MCRLAHNYRQEKRLRANIRCNSRNCTQGRYNYGISILYLIPICFEVIHPFQDGNGRVGRLILFKECLANGHVPFIITEELKMFYYRDTCLTAQDNYKEVLDKYRIKY